MTNFSKTMNCDKRSDVIPGGIRAPKVAQPRLYK